MTPVIDIRQRAHAINYARRHAQLRETVYARPGFSFDVDRLASRVRSAMQRGDLVAVLAIAYDQSIDEHVRREAVALGRKYYLAHRQAFIIGASPLGASTAARAQPPVCSGGQTFPIRATVPPRAVTPATGTQPGSAPAPVADFLIAAE